MKILQISLILTLIFHQIYSSELEQQQSPLEIELPDTKTEYIKILCLNRKTGEFLKTSLDNNELLDSVINVNQTTVFIIHGWTENPNLTFFDNLPEAFSKFTEWNICNVNWSPLASKDILRAYQSTYFVNTFLADFIIDLTAKKKIKLDQIVLVGHSFGAQIAAFCGMQLNGKLGAIYALDPIAPQLTPTSALYTQCILTETGMFRSAIGHCETNFYVNGGQSQPICHNSNDPLCSHRVSVLYFIFSLNVRNQFLCRSCKFKVFNVFCFYEEIDLMGIYSQRKIGSFDCFTTNQPPFTNHFIESENLTNVTHPTQNSNYI
uniref:CSON012753 protein n=1 Tax=Culicoides sonorensis TaxID=179676 RepID=A0A336MAJ9_CULSO